jgi:hypothetical protein
MNIEIRFKLNRLLNFDGSPKFPAKRSSTIVADRFVELSKNFLKLKNLFL